MTTDLYWLKKIMQFLHMLNVISKPWVEQKSILSTWAFCKLFFKHFIVRIHFITQITGWETNTHAKHNSNYCTDTDTEMYMK